MKTAAVKILERLKLPYELRAYEEEALSADEAAHKLGLPLDRVFKTLVVRGDRGGVVLACLPGSGTLSLKKLAAASGNKRCELVEVEEIHRLTGYLRGGVSPLGARKGYPLFLDASAQRHETIGVSAGMRGLELLLAADALVTAGRATLTDLAE
ncbi:MAG TPA: aminoacyl-tRNA deacylase [Dehalococcoidia bacterium]|nr:aminoacyl-tRNA deacylase [Dehalococcoidia bacterium]